MKTYVLFCGASLLGMATLLSQDQVGLQNQVGIEGVEVLTRGPIHEAFAGTITYDPEPGVVVQKAIPDPIEEMPPDQKPTGENVAWIPGYWGWDDERNDYVWISGIWRSVPPGRQWISGYWASSANESQWTSGYWADSEANQVEYLPEPPKSIEEGPNIASPSADHTWLPGCWIWQQDRYVWRPGYWALAEPNWIWNPSHYVWTPRGYVFVEGYYDYPVAQRGTLFAPVYLNSTVYKQQGFSFSPRTVINPAVFAAHLFSRPNYGHYYFGDYYGNNYTQSGFFPGFSLSISRRGYDPLFAHQNWNHRNDRQWNEKVETEFAYRRDHNEARPPRTWADQLQIRLRNRNNQDNSFEVASTLDELAKNKDHNGRFQPMAKHEREKYGQNTQQVRAAIEERRQLEAQAARSSNATASQESRNPLRGKLPKTPIVSQPRERLHKDHVPPKAVDAPKPDHKIQPKSRRPNKDGNEGKKDSDSPKPNSKRDDS